MKEVAASLQERKDVTAGVDDKIVLERGCHCCKWIVLCCEVEVVFLAVLRMVWLSLNDNKCYGSLNY